MASTNEEVATGLRLLPWSSPEGKPCYLSTDDPDSRLSTLADEVEAEQLHTAHEVLRHACTLLRSEGVALGEARFTARRLTECLRDVLRIVESRATADAVAPDDDAEAHPHLSAEAFG